MFGLGVGEIVIVLVIALIFIGPKKLPELAKGLGKGLREFQNAMKGISNTVQAPLDQMREPLDQMREPLDQIKEPFEQVKAEKDEIQKRIKDQLKSSDIKK
jgi:TatA/E family protein of Tat protein translocase